MPSTAEEEEANNYRPDHPAIDYEYDDSVAAVAVDACGGSDDDDPGLVVGPNVVVDNLHGNASVDDHHNGDATTTRQDPLQDEFQRMLQEEFDHIIQQEGDEEEEEEEEEEEDYDDDDDNDESTTAGMWLSPKERECALLIKNAVEEEPELDNLNDYWYAHLAIFELKHHLPQQLHQDNNNNNHNEAEEADVNINLLLQSALRRVHGIQTFRQEQNIVDTPLSGKRVFQDCIMNIFPGWLMGLSCSLSEGGYTMVHDANKITREVLIRNPTALDVYLRAVYFLFQATSDNFLNCRAGIYSIAECEGQEFSKAPGVNFMRRLWMEIGTVYPVLFQKFEHVHAGMFPTLLWNMSKRFLPQRFKVKGMIDFTNSNDVERLDKLYLIPNLQTANDRLLSTLVEGLQKRYHNESTFRL